MFGGGNPFSTQAKTIGSGLTLSTTSIPASQSLFSLTPCTASGTMFNSGFTTTVSSSGASMFPGVNTNIVTSLPSTGIFSGLQTKSAALPGFNFGTGTSSTVPLTGLNVGFGGTTLNIPTTTTNTTTSVGLGGVDISQTSTGGGISSTQSDNKAAVKETILPNEISSSLEIFKKYVKDQKIIREEITRVSSKPILKVQEETIALKQMLSIVSNGLQRNAVAVEKLKQETAQELKNAEIAQRTKDMPPTLQYENTAPVEYFQNLVTKCESQMQLYRQQIEQLEKHLVSMSQPSVLTPQELTVIMKRLHEAFVALAAHLQLIHEAVHHQKEQFLSYRRLIDGDNKNIFEQFKKNKNGIYSYPEIPVTIGPGPFSNTPSPAAIAMASALNRTQHPSGLGTGSFGAQPNLFSGSTLNLGSSSIFKPLGSLNTNSTFGSSLLVPNSDVSPQTPYPISNQNKPFQLQKPPAGNKRGKRWTST
ncbi:nucleoporin p58/p45-like isoform X2 [Centruroides sculpturatus]|uniref:nucleoporin p58/p45-like isoform X2 n=1 Tax=Centruroides sculpturatus TaxID=218467 RepID=UPI000C6D8D46|nr:nucleoporin p58/p45-like isoform X2 [Centruroides sculpturatus]